jgi:autotransporter passenger strand-loop-strand repeat protein
VRGGGTIQVHSAGLAANTVVSSGGTATVLNGGTARSTKLTGAGATLAVSSGGVASATIISSGGSEHVSGGGIDRLSVISSGGAEFIQSAGIVSGTTIISGAKLTVSSGGVIQSGLTVSGGTAVISGTMAAGQKVEFGGAGGDLALYNLPSFAAQIGGFGASDKFDLGGFAYGAGETRSFTEAASHASGTLKVVDGAKSASLTLLGSYVSGDFALSTDGAGGTFVKFV